MLKWLRKYNSYILVVGGVLLMVAFLLPETVRQLGQHPIGAAPMRIDGRKVSFDAHDFARREFYAVKQLVGDGMTARLGAGENFEHWILLTREAERYGFVGGKHDGADFLPLIARDAVRAQYEQLMQFMNPAEFAQRIETESKQLADGLVNNGIPQLMSSTRLSEDEIYRALGKLHAVARMRSSYFNSAAGRFSGPRLVEGAKSLMDAAKIDAVFVPPEREFANIAQPTPDEVQAHFAKYKTNKPGEGEYGIGYLLPDRVKISYLTIDQRGIEGAIVPDAVDVRKRFLKQFPSGTPPNGETAAIATQKIEQDVRTEELAKVMRAVDQTVKSEFERSTRKLEADGDYKKLPANWATIRPDFNLMRDSIVERVKAMTGTTIPVPTVTVKDAQWLTKSDLAALSGIGGATLARGTQSETLADVIFKVRELAGRSDYALQAGVPSMEFASDLTNARFYFMVLDVRKESAPDSAAEIEPMLMLDARRVAAFERMKSQEGAFRLLAETTAEGLQAVSKAGATSPADELPIKTGLTIQGERMTPPDANLDREEFRKAVLAAATELDPVTDVANQELSKRIVVVPLAKSLGIGIAKILTVSPVTEERFRSLDGGRVAGELVKRAAVFTIEDPFSLKRMESRLKVEYTDGRKEEAGSKTADASSSKS